MLAMGREVLNVLTAKIKNCCDQHVPQRGRNTFLFRYMLYRQSADASYVVYSSV
jgi:hypothetical protein